MRFSFIPREQVFFPLFEENARNMVKAAQSLKELVDSWQDVEQKVNEITQLEHQGDLVTHKIMAQLHRTFVTPFDREDIAQLAHTMDDITDFIHAASDAMLLYKVDRPGRRAKELADIIVQGATEIERAMPKLRRRGELKKILKRCVELNRLENAADRVYRSAIAELFSDSSDMAHVIKWREIYEHMESATDRCEDVANVLEGVAIKYA
ncbi:MAG: phosphate transport regulator [Chloroflexi bacterium RBG_13_56_8b]|nr:MAG: phosphate transport regulator [Chloroflexi bacterium RBG_13_56_8b]